MRILVVDAFTDRPFAGNPAGVCLLAEPAAEGWMQTLAAEMRHAETAYVRPLGDGDPDADYELRWFTPAVEVPLCGHATLASAHALYETGTAPAGRPIRFRTLHSGVLTVRQGAGELEMDFPARPLAAARPPADLAEALGAEPVWTGRADHDDLVALLPDEDAVRGLDPDIEMVAGIEARAIGVTAPGSGGHDYVARWFAPRVGIPEDPVTGSAHCVLGPYWAGRLGRDSLAAYQASERGGALRVSVRGDRVVLGGTAVTVLDGDLKG